MTRLNTGTRTWLIRGWSWTRTRGRTLTLTSIRVQGRRQQHRDFPIARWQIVQIENEVGSQFCAYVNVWHYFTPDSPPWRQKQILGAPHRHSMATLKIKKVKVDHNRNKQDDRCRLCHSLAHSIFALASCSLCLSAFSQRFFEKKKCVSIVSKCSKTHRNDKKIYPLDPLRALRIAQSLSGVAQWNINTINRTKIPTFSPSLIKIQLIVTEI